MALDHVLVWQQTLLAGISNLVLFPRRDQNVMGFQIVSTKLREDEDGPASRHRLCDLLANPLCCSSNCLLFSFGR